MKKFPEEFEKELPGRMHQIFLSLLFPKPRIITQIYHVCLWKLIREFLIKFLIQLLQKKILKKFIENFLKELLEKFLKQLLIISDQTPGKSPKGISGRFFKVVLEGAHEDFCERIHGGIL